MWFVCGLGNPGKKYLNTRHNVGFNIIDMIVEKYNFVKSKNDKSKEVYSGIISNQKFILCKPLNFMNLSGSVINDIIKYYKIPKSKIFIIHDDLDLVLGKVKIKSSGGNGGHNGLASIDALIGNNYKRLRIGIGHPGAKELVSKYVLEKFDKEEKEKIDKKFDIIVKYFFDIFDDKIKFLNKISLDK